MRRDQDMQKITVEVPRDILERAKAYTGEGTTDIIRRSLDEYVKMQGRLKLLSLQGSYKPSITVEEMRSWEDD